MPPTRISTGVLLGTLGVPDHERVAYQIHRRGRRGYRTP